MPFSLSRFIIISILFSLSASAGSIAGSLLGFQVLLFQYPHTDAVSGLLPALLWPRFTNLVLFGAIIGILARIASDFRTLLVEKKDKVEGAGGQATSEEASKSETRELAS